MINSKTLVVIGGGAAGFFCAINAARLNKNLQVIILEKSSKLLSKVKVSGGGRCNVTHNCMDIEAMAKNYPRGERFLKKAFHWFGVQDTIDWFYSRGVALKTEVDGRMFPVTNQSQSIINCLLHEAQEYGVDVKLNAGVTCIEKKEDVFEITVEKNNQKITAHYICLATGGIQAIEKYIWLENLGHTIEEPAPSLFTFNIPGNSITTLMGVSVPQASVQLVGSKLKTCGPLLITHWGLSGPAVLKLSSIAARELKKMNYEFNVRINWVAQHSPDYVHSTMPLIREKTPTAKIYSHNPYNLPTRLWQHLVDLSKISHITTYSDLKRTQIDALAKFLCMHDFIVKGKTTFKEEFVTCGGIKLTDVDVNTMQSKHTPYLFLAGEVLDVDGITGGFNFQNAWTTGWIAAKAIAQFSA